MINYFIKFYTRCGLISKHVKCIVVHTETLETWRLIKFQDISGSAEAFVCGVLLW